MAKTPEKTESAAAVAKIQTEEMQTVIYVGPLVRGTILTPMTIFENGIPKEYREHPLFRHLFVAPERLDQARKEIGRRGSLRNTYYNRAIAESQKKGSE